MSFPAKRFNTICFICMFLLGFSFAIYQSLIQDINLFLGFDGAQSGLLVAVFFVGALVSPGITGELGDRIGKRMLSILSGGAMLFGIAIVSQARDAALVIAGIFLMGAGYNALLGLLYAKIIDYNPHTARRIANFSSSTFCLGAVLGPLLSLAIRSMGGNWQRIMLINVFLFFPIILLLLWIPSDKQTASTNKPARNRAYSLDLIKDVRFLIFFFSIILYVGAEVALSFSVISYFAAVSLPALGEIALSLFWAGMIVGRFLAGVFYKQSGRIIILCLTASAVFSLLLQLAPPPLVSVALFCLIGLSMSALWPLLMALCTQTFSQFSGTASGLMAVGSSLGGIFLPALMGPLTNLFGVRRSIAFTTASLALVLVFNLRNRKNHQETT